MREWNKSETSAIARERAPNVQVSLSLSLSCDSIFALFICTNINTLGSKMPSARAISRDQPSHRRDPPLHNFRSYDLPHSSTCKCITTALEILVACDYLDEARNCKVDIEACPSVGANEKFHEE